MRHLLFGALVYWPLLGIALALPTPTPLEPAAIHRHLDQTIASLLSHYHYRREALDDALSRVVLQNYLDALDPLRGYFLQAEVDEFRNRYATTLDDALKVGDLAPAFALYNDYQQRLHERTQFALQRLQQPFDFEVDESLVLDRKEASWPSDEAEKNAFWIKRLKNETLLLMLAGKSQEAAREVLVTRYEGRWRRASQTTAEDAFQVYMNAVAQSFDPHTAYFSPRNSENFNIQMRLSLEGIGTVLRLDEEMVTVVRLVKGGPAAMSQQLQPNDWIVGVGQNDGTVEDIVGWRLDDVVDLIRGPRGTRVTLKVLPADARSTPKLVSLVRDQIKLEEQAAQSRVETVTTDGGPLTVGVITLPTFYSDFSAAQQGDANYRSTTRDVRRLLEELNPKAIDTLLIDLRGNGGGSLQEAVDLTGLFIPTGPVVQVRNHRGAVEVEQDRDPTVVYNGPLVVLVDRFSASAAEIFAGAIQDYGRGVVVGSPTFGKGTVQTLLDLNRYLPKESGQLGQLKLTVAKFYRISGGSTQHRGVLPNIELPSPFSAEDVGESAQPTALPWDEIRPQRYASNALLRTLQPTLRTRHEQRLREDPALQLWKQEVALLRQARRESTTSLQLAARQAESRRAEAQARAQENQWRRRQGLAPLGDQEPLPVRDEEDRNRPDPVGDEAVRIAADLADLLRDRPTALVTQTQP